MSFENEISLVESNYRDANYFMTLVDPLNEQFNS